MPSLENKTITEKKFQFALMLAADIKYNFMYFCLFPVICRPCLQLFCSNSKRSHIALIGGCLPCQKNSKQSELWKIAIKKDKIKLMQLHDVVNHCIEITIFLNFSEKDKIKGTLIITPI